MNKQMIDEEEEVQYKTEKEEQEEQYQREKEEQKEQYQIEKEEQEEQYQREREEQEEQYQREREKKDQEEQYQREREEQYQREREKEEQREREKKDQKDKQQEQYQREREEIKPYEYNDKEINFIRLLEKSFQPLTNEQLRQRQVLGKEGIVNLTYVKDMKTLRNLLNETYGNNYMINEKEIKIQLIEGKKITSLPSMLSSVESQKKKGEKETIMMDKSTRDKLNKILMNAEYYRERYKDEEEMIWKREREEQKRIEREEQIMYELELEEEQKRQQEEEEEQKRQQEEEEQQKEKSLHQQPLEQPKQKIIIQQEQPKQKKKQKIEEEIVKTDLEKVRDKLTSAQREFDRITLEFKDPNTKLSRKGQIVQSQNQLRKLISNLKQQEKEEEEKEKTRIWLEKNSVNSQKIEKNRVFNTSYHLLFNENILYKKVVVIAELQLVIFETTSKRNLMEKSSTSDKSNEKKNQQDKTNETRKFQEIGCYSFEIDLNEIKNMVTLLYNESYEKFYRRMDRKIFERQLNLKIFKKELNPDQYKTAKQKKEKINQMIEEMKNREIAERVLMIQGNTILEKLIYDMIISVKLDETVENAKISSLTRSLAYIFKSINDLY